MRQIRLLSSVAAVSFSALSVCSARDPAPPFYTDKTELLAYIDQAGAKHTITAAKDWQKRRRHILANMQLVMGPAPDASQKVPLDVQVAEEIKTPHYVRKRLTFAAEKNDRVPAYVLVPLGHTERIPAELCLHQTARIGKGEPARPGEREDSSHAVHLAH